MSGRFVISGAMVIDGTGNPGRVADVSVVDDRIEAIGQLEASADDRIDGTGQVLAPGFIDTHSHDDYAVILYPDMGFKINGGVTTVVVGNCGGGAAPYEFGTDFAQLLHGHVSLPEWEGYGGYFQYLDGKPPSVNVAVLIGHGTIRGGVMGTDDRAPSAGELDAMRAMVNEGMDAGCVGMSTGLVYPPGKFADTDEIVALAKVVAGGGGLYASHIRNEGKHLLEAIDEAIEIGRRADLSVVISHLKAAGSPNHGMVSQALEHIAAAGPTVAADQYPYAAGSTGLSSVVDGSVGNVAPDLVVIASTEMHPAWHGRTLADLAPELGVAAEHAGQAVLDAEPKATAIIHVMDEDDVRTVVSNTEVMVGSDGVPTLDGQPHPRLYGTFARVLGRYSRDLGLLTLEQAIHKMTGRSAAVFGLVDRGEIRPGAFADLVLFNPMTIADRGTFEEPHHSPDGIDRVWVNGRLVVENGVHSGTRPGRALRRR